MEEDDFLTASDIRGFYATREGGLTALGLALSARIALNERQRRWAEARVGKEGAAVKALAQAGEVLSRRAERIAVEAERASVPVPESRAKTMIVAGRVTLQGKGVADYTVAAYDSEGKLAGKSCSGESGTFVMDVEPDQPFRLVVLDLDGGECHADLEERPYTPGETLFVTLEIGKNGATCKAPPDRRPTPNTFAMPDLVGMKVKEAQKVIKQAKLTTGRSTTVVLRDKAGLVVDHTPVAGAAVTEGTIVDLAVAVATETDEVEIPGVEGHSLASARKVLEQAGLTLGEVFTVTRAAPEGIAEQSPPAGEKLARGAKVAVTLGVAKDLDLDRETIADLFDVEESHAAAAISGTELLQRLQTAGLKSLEQVRKVKDMSDEALTKIVGIIDANRLTAIRAGLVEVVRKIDEAR